MGVDPTARPGGQQTPVPPGPEQDAILSQVTGELTNKGFVIAQLDKLVNWSRTGSLWPMTLTSNGTSECRQLFRNSQTTPFQKR